jgi:hypothetical protein
VLTLTRKSSLTQLSSNATFNSILKCDPETLLGGLISRLSLFCDILPWFFYHA